MHQQRRQRESEEGASARSRSFRSSSIEGEAILHKPNPSKPFFSKMPLVGVMICLTLLYGLYLHGAHERKAISQDLKRKISCLEERLNKAAALREDLVLQLESQEDPLWIEMLIKEHLGMVSKNQTKVYFESD